MPKLRTLAPRLRHVEPALRLPPKTVDPSYTTPAYRAWRSQILDRAGHRCEWLDDHGLRCTIAAPHHRMYADHIVELRDGGSLLDLANGQCLCRSHHELKTLRHRYFRHRQVFDRGE